MKANNKQIAIGKLIIELNRVERKRGGKQKLLKNIPQVYYMSENGKVAFVKTTALKEMSADQIEKYINKVKEL